MKGPSRIGGTRWIPHFKEAIRAFKQSFHAIDMQLSNARNTNIIPKPRVCVNGSEK